MHLVWALAFVAAFVVLASLTILRMKKVRASGTGSEDGNAIYKVARPYAHAVKVVLQMAIALVTVAAVGWQFFSSRLDSSTSAIGLLLHGVGVGLAAAAVVELAYTLFTPGPDEALDPLMLGVSAALLIEVSKTNELTANRAWAFVLMGVLLAVLFATRLILAERDDDKGPDIWWIPRRRRTDEDA